MRVGRRFLPVVVLLGVLAATAAVALAGGVSWGSAIEVPGVAALSGGSNDYGRVASVSCAVAGECAAVGLANYGHPFVVSEQGGVWGSASGVVGPANDTPWIPWLVSVSCGSPGNCAAGGTSGDVGAQAIVMSEDGGVWGTAIEVPGIAALNVGGSAGVASVSCASAGDCAAAGTYAANTDKYGFPGDSQGFVASEQGGVWDEAVPAPSGALSPDDGRPNSYLDSVSCGGAGDCAAGGGYYLRGTATRWSWAVLVNEREGEWGTGMRVPGTKTLGFNAGVTSVSCASPGNCAAGGFAGGNPSSPRRFQAFVVNEKGGKWGRAILVPGLAALNVGGYAWLASISCAGAGNCAAGGYYTVSGRKRAFVVTENNGTWRRAINVPGAKALGVSAAVTSVSCASPGNCAASGNYVGSHKTHAFVVSERNGVWGTAVEVPGTAALGVAAGASSISCASAGNCAIGGNYGDGSNHSAPFVTAP